MRDPGKRIAEHNRACIEAMWTADDALAWAESRWPRWPTRRWRLEGARGGHSRMLTWKAATDAQRRVGGHLVELIPPIGQRPRATAADCNEAAHAGEDGVRFCSSRCPGRKRPRKRRATVAEVAP